MGEEQGISIRARFDHAPTSLKGALILRGEDANPHQVVLSDVRLVAVDGTWDAGRALRLPGSTVDVAPRRDVFVPFEVGVADLDPGWYGFRCETVVDGIAGTFDGGRRFAVPWPRGSVRRTTVKVDAALRLGAASIRVAQVECAGDSVRVPFVAEPAVRPTATASADGVPVPVIDVEVDAAGKGRVLAYPALRSHATYRVEFAVDGASATLDVPLA